MCALTHSKRRSIGTIWRLTMTFGNLLAAAVLVTALIASGPAIAGPKHCPPGHAKKGW